MCSDTSALKVGISTVVATIDIAVGAGGGFSGHGGGLEQVEAAAMPLLVTVPIPMMQKVNAIEPSCWLIGTISPNSLPVGVLAAR